MNGNMRNVFLPAIGLLDLTSSSTWSGAQTTTSPAAAANKVITEADCTAAKVGSDIPASALGEPVSGVTLNAPVWTGAAGANPAYCSVKGAMAPVDANAKPINFQVVFPASWRRRAAQLGGGGMNGSIPNLLGGVDMGPVTGGNRSLPRCSYPKYPRYVSGPADSASSYACTAP